MAKSANEVMQDVVAAAVLDGIAALKGAAKGLPNTLWRDVGAIHANTTIADLPDELRAAIAESTRGAFTRLLREGYSVMPTRPDAPRPRPPQGERIERGNDRRGPLPPRGGRPGGPRPPKRPS